MTTIAANRNSIACDLQFTYGGNMKFKGVTKVLDVPPAACEDIFNVDRCLIGFSGNADTWGEVVAWFYDTSQKAPKCNGIEFLMLNSKHQLFHGTNLRNWMLLPEKHFAIGSGMDFAIGAMTSGKTPLEAVKVASKHDSKTGMGFKEYFID